MATPVLFLDRFAPTNQAAAPGNMIWKNLGKMIQVFETVPGDHHAGFNSNGEDIRSADDQQVYFVALAVRIKKIAPL